MRLTDGTGSRGSAGATRDAAAMASAEARVERLFARLSRIELPVWSGVVREADPEAFQDAREIALARADAAGRRDLLDLARERVALAYAHHLAGLGYWTAVFAVPVPLGPGDRADSQAIVEDLVTALIVEDIVPDGVADILRADGERLLRSAAIDGGPDEGEDDGAAPIDPFRGPLIAATPGRGIVLLTLGTLYYWGALIAALVSGPFILRALSPRQRDLVLAVLLGSLASVLVAGAMQDVTVGVLAGVVTAAALVASSFGLDWWSGRRALRHLIDRLRGRDPR